MVEGGFMLRICICDDSHEQQSLVRKATEKYFKTRGDYSIQVTCYDNPLLFLEEMNQNGGYDILLLDIFMPGINGIEVAKEIRKRKDKTEIVFLTTSDDFAVAAFSLKAVHYLVKPFMQSEFDEAMDRAVASFAKSNVLKLSFKLMGGGIKTVDIDDILYIESYKHEQQVHLKEGDSLYIREALNSLQKQLEELSPNQFLSPYKGYIVNLNAVYVIEPDCMKLHGNKSVPIAHRSFRELTDKYLAYAFGGSDQ
jgi:DNA-binding LytR/AlgR family response regulator